MRPDLFDAHTLHWHGFRNVIPFFDGEPTGSVSVPAGTVFRYVYRPREAGTYMYHCHVEDVEHVHMGMNGMVFVRPARLATRRLSERKYLYNDGDGSTGLRPGILAAPLGGVGRVALGRRPHPASRMERLPGRLRSAQRSGLSRHRRPQRPVQRRLDAGDDRGRKPYMPVARPTADGTLDRTRRPSRTSSTSRCRRS